MHPLPAALLLALLLSACGVLPFAPALAPVPDSEPVNPVVVCQTPRPMVCTMDYAPVCATLRSGSNRDYASACNACADDTVASYLDGMCDGPAQSLFGGAVLAPDQRS